jgi:basic membrane protein A
MLLGGFHRMLSKSKTLIALFAVLALFAAACGGDDDAGGDGDSKICEVTDTGGVDDKGFNASAWAGAQLAADDFSAEAKVLESQAETDYEVNLNSFVDQGCDLIVTVGFLLGNATKDNANVNADQKYTIVDFAYGNEMDADFNEILDDDGNTIPEIKNANVKGLIFNTDEAAFLAGYVAAGTTATGTIGTFGGINIPPVTIFMNGLARGVDHYNTVNGTSVKVLGWDPATQEGSFTNNFESLDDGRAFAQSLVDEGADIVMPVAGPVGLGAAALASELGTFYMIGVDVDGFEADQNNSSVYLTSVLKRIDNAVYAAADETLNGTFSDALYVGTLENEGVGLASYHDLADMVSSDLQDEVEALKADIISGAVSVTG